MATIPGPLENDAEDVSLALEVAQTQLARGDLDEALKWLRKAVDAAFEAEDDKRGIELSKTAAELSAEAKEQRKKPKLPQPRANTAPRETAPPPRPSSMPRETAPPPRPSSTPQQPRPSSVPREAAPQQRRPSTSAPPPPGRSAPPPPHKAAAARRGSRPAAEEALEATGTRRAAKAQATRRGSRPAPDDPRRAQRPAASPVVLDDEATREFLVSDPGEADVVGVAGEWPAEAVERVDDVDQTLTRKSSDARAGARSADAKLARPPRTREEPRPSRPPGRDARAHSQPAIGVPATRAVRVAASRAPDGRTVVRLLDAHGLRPGEHDAILVALTSDGDIRDLFR